MFERNPFKGTISCFRNTLHRSELISHLKFHQEFRGKIFLKYVFILYFFHGISKKFRGNSSHRIVNEIFFQLHSDRFVLISRHKGSQKKAGVSRFVDGKVTWLLQEIVTKPFSWVSHSYRFSRVEPYFGKFILIKSENFKHLSLLTPYFTDVIQISREVSITKFCHSFYLIFIFYSLFDKLFIQK